MAYAFAEVMGREKTSPVEVPKRLDKFLHVRGSDTELSSNLVWAEWQAGES